MVDRKENFKFDLGVKGLTIQMKASKHYFRLALLIFIVTIELHVYDDQ